MDLLRFAVGRAERRANFKKHGVAFEEAKSVFYDERARLITAGLRQVERYSWRECAQRTLQVILATR